MARIVCLRLSKIRKAGPGLIAKIENKTKKGLPLLRLTNGSLIAGDASVRELSAKIGDVIIYDGVAWEIGEEANWEPIREVGVVIQLKGSLVLIYSNQRFLYRTLPAGWEIEPGFKVVFDQRRELVDYFEKELPQSSLKEDEIDVSVFGRDLDESKFEWSAFAGFPEILQEAQEIVAVHSNVEKRKELSSLGVDPVRGILFEGPPGTGKTLLAQIMAAQSKAKFYLVTTASLGGRLVGESEQRLEAIYADAARQTMSIIFVDEIEVITKDRAFGQDSGSRLVNVFLTNMDGVAAPNNVITIGTTNRIEDIDKALRRPGRFDREISFRNPDREDRRVILSARHRHTAGEIDYERVADSTEGWTAAELGAIWQHAGELTVTTGRNSIYNEHFLVGFERAKAARDKRLKRE